MDTSDFFPKSTSSQSFLVGFCQLSIIDALKIVLKPVGTIENCSEASWNQSSHIKKEYSSKMEHSYYYQKNGTLIKHGTH